jgi:type IV secretory pathway TraG/TraD family ATPase VirD4
VRTQTPPGAEEERPFRASRPSFPTLCAFPHTLRQMLETNHLATPGTPSVHPVVASAAREVLNKSANERSGVLSTAMLFLGLYRDPVVASRC